MMKAVWTGAVAAAVVLLANPVSAANDTKNVTVTVHVNARAKLTLTATAVDFADTDPDSGGGVINATPFNVNVKARTTRTGTVNLDVSAPDFSNGSGDSIAIGKLSYAATGSTGYVAGNPFTTGAASAGTWTGSGNQAGTHTYTLVNDWAYNTGTYTSSVTYTLTAP
jgi:hypothetical protein